MSDALVGNFNDKATANKTVGYLRRLAKRLDAAVLFLAHPSGKSIASGDGASGDRAWSNSVRARFYLQTPDKNKDTRRLELKKSNYSTSSATIDVRWVNGGFEIEDASAPKPHERIQDKNLTSKHRKNREIQENRIQALESLLCPEGLPNPMSTVKLVEPLAAGEFGFGKKSSEIRQNIRRNLRYDALNGGRLLE